MRHLRADVDGTSAPLDRSYGNAQQLAWEEMSQAARERLEESEEKLEAILGSCGYPGLLSADESRVMHRYILANSLPEWLCAHNLSVSDPRKFQECEAMLSALEKLAIFYGLG